jgi:hypothetical protein
MLQQQRLDAMDLAADRVTQRLTPSGLPRRAPLAAKASASWRPSA